MKPNMATDRIQAITIIELIKNLTDNNSYITIIIDNKKFIFSKKFILASMHGGLANSSAAIDIYHLDRKNEIINIS